MKALLLRFSSLGDVVLATAAARELKRLRPGVRVVFAAKAAFAPILEGQPDIDEVWVLDQGGFLGLLKRVRAERFDLVLDLHSSLRSRALSALSGAPVTRWQSFGLNRRLRVSAPFLSLAEPAPVATRYAQAAARALGEAWAPPAPLPRLEVASEAAAWAGDWLHQQGWVAGQKLLAVAPGAAWATKRWRPEHLAQCLAMVSEFDKVRFVLLGSPKEAALIDEVLGFMKKGRANALRADHATGDLRRLASLIRRCDHFLGHDSGPMHVAEALGVPITALFGPTVRAFGFYPQGEGHTVFERDLACRPCSVHGSERCPLGHHDCMETLEPFEVAQHLRRRLGLEP